MSVAEVRTTPRRSLTCCGSVIKSASVHEGSYIQCVVRLGRARLLYSVEVSSAGRRVSCSTTKRKEINNPLLLLRRQSHESYRKVLGARGPRLDHKSRHANHKQFDETHASPPPRRFAVEQLFNLWRCKGLLYRKPID